MEAKFVLRTRDDTQMWGRALGHRLQPGDVIALIGDLGAGKTTLTQGIGQGMGITERITSPTFTLVQEYEGTVPLFHFDPYRLERPEDVWDLGFADYLERPAVLVVEWADRIAPLLPTERLTLVLREQEEEKMRREDENIEPEAAAARLLTVTATGARYEWLLEQLFDVPPEFIPAAHICKQVHLRKVR